MAVAEHPVRRVMVAELGSAWIGIAAGLGLTILRAANGDDYDRAVLPTVAFGMLVAVPGFLALIARRWHRPALYLASGLIYIPSTALSLAGVTLPLIFCAAMAFVAYGRHADEEVPIVWAPLTAVVLLVLTITTWAGMMFNGGDDPRCSSTATSMSCTSDVITNGEALFAIAGVVLVLAAGLVMSRPQPSSPLPPRSRL